MEFNRESIFAGSLRSFCKSIATILGIAIGIGFVMIGLAILVGPNYYPPKSQPLILPDADGNRDMLSGSSPVILCIDIHGVIGMGDLTSGKIGNLLLDSREDFLRGRVKAILLNINTPGGSSVDSDTIYRTLISYKQQYHVPIYAYVDGLCASGGMYVACAADKIYASESSIIGSVGVILGPNFNFSDAMSRYGVGALTLTEGKDKDELNPFRPWRPNEGAPLKAAMEILYDRFVSIVAASRPQLTKDLLINVYGAHVFAAKEAEKLGYIDVGSADYRDTVRALAEVAQISEKERYQVVRLSPPRPFFSDLAQSFSPVKVIRSALGLSPTDLSGLNGQFLYYYQP